jgi:hypothetical protein
MTAPGRVVKPGGRAAAPLGAEARQVQLKTWVVLLVVTAVVAVVVLADRDASPVLSGVLVTIPILELMIFGVWYRRAGSGGRPR